MRSSAALVLLAACMSRPHPLVICHNANCTGASSDRDDTLGALDASLATETGAFDGLEIDFAWQDGRCVFAHAPELDAPDARAAAERIAAAPGRFALYVELKPAGDPPPAEFAACALDAIRRIPYRELAVSSFSPALLDAVAADPAWPGGALVAELLPPTRADLDGFHVTGVSVDPFQVDRAAFARFHDLGLAIALWSDVVTPELLDWIDAEAPRWVSVGDASLVRAWIGE